MNVYTDPKLLDVHGALDVLPTLQPAEQETNQATGTNDSQVVGSVGLVGHFPPSLSKVSVLKQEPESENGPRLVPPKVPPENCPNETIQVVSGGLDELPVEGQNIEKPHESRGNVGLSEWAMRGSNPRPSRCKRDALAN